MVSIPDRVLGFFRHDFLVSGVLWDHVSIPDRVLGFFRQEGRYKLCRQIYQVSIPDRVLGFFRPPVPEALVYLVFKVQFRESQTKVPFPPAACQYPKFHTHFKSLSCKASRLSVNRFFRGGASNTCGT